jgi:hypothetical protein
MYTTKDNGKHKSTKTAFPAFDPEKYEVKARTFGDTGGGCTVGSIKFYLPEIDRSVWVNCTDESAAIYTIDYIWGEDDSFSLENPDDAFVIAVIFDNEQPEDVKQWLPLILETLAYTVEQETAQYPNHTFTLPVAWLPDSIRENANPNYLARLREQGKKVEIAMGGAIFADDDYCDK